MPRFCGILRVPNVIMVNPSFPAKTLPEFIAHAKANPGMINMATAGIGSTLHIFGELFKMMVGVDLVTVHYHGGGAALTDLLGGRVQVIFDPLGEAIGYIRAGRLRALAVTSATRAAAVPDIPTVAEFVPGYEADGWSGMAAPKNTPVAIIDKLNKDINAGLADPKMKAQLADLGSMPLAGSQSASRRLEFPIVPLLLQLIASPFWGFFGNSATFDRRKSARWPREVQEIGFDKGMIPYIPVDRD
jgi:tripartite-type tricarboxylate transporter receptor subunit TctC